MTFRLQGPFPLDLQDLGASARSAVGEARLAMGDRDFSSRLRNSAATGREYGLYLLWDDPEGGGASAAPSLIGFWLTFGPSYVEGGPQEPLERHPPFAEPILDALTEEVWWQGLRVAPRDPDPRWRPLIVLEWPASLANRSACPPPGVAPSAEKSGRGQEREDYGNWLSLEEYDAAPTKRMAVIENPEEERRLPDQRSLVAVVQGDLHLKKNQHEARYSLVHLPEELGLGEELAPLETWLQRAMDGGAKPSAAQEQAPGATLALPGGRVGYALSGWLTAALDIWPAKPSGAIEGVLLGRDVGSRWKVQAKTTASIVTSVVVLVLAMAAMVQEFTRPRAHAGPPPVANEAQPALSVCSVDNEQFVQELRCQVDAFADNRPLTDHFCGDRAAEGQQRDPRPAPVPHDLQAAWCGLRDRDIDEWKPIAIPEEAGPGQIKLRTAVENGGFADLAAAKACYNVLQHPQDYRLDPGEPDLYHLPNPDRFIIDKVYEVASLRRLVVELDAACDAFRPRLERQIEGAVVAAHVGGSALPARQVDTSLLEGKQLRQYALIKAGEALPPTERICLEEGATAGPWAASGYGGLCAGGIPPATGESWEALGRADLQAVIEDEAEDPLTAALNALDAAEPGTPAAVAAGLPQEPGATPPIGDALVDRYVRARFSPQHHPSKAYEQVVQGAPSLWKCHLALADPDLPMTSAKGSGYLADSIRVRWDLQVPVPRRYPANGEGAVLRQLELDAALSDINEASLDLGSCWEVVARRLVRYRPVHPLLPDREMQPWPSEEQQLCAQVCAVRYRIRESPRRDEWFTRESDIERCVDRTDPTTFVNGSGRAFTELRMPWNYSRDGVWQRPYAHEICAFNLVAQDYLSGEQGQVILDGTPAPRWAGETIDSRVGGETLAGGMDLRKLGFERPESQLPRISSEPGGAWQAAINLESYGRARSVSTCGHAATQCFASQMLGAISSDADQPHRWMAAWSLRMARLTSGEGSDDLDAALEAETRRRPAASDAERSYGSGRVGTTAWCRLIQPYLAGEGGLPEGQLDFPCASGVEQTRAAVEAMLAQMAAGGRAQVEAAQ